MRSSLFEVVEWLSPFRLGAEILAGELEAILPPGCIGPFGKLEVNPDDMCVVPALGANVITLAEISSVSELKSLLRAIPDEEDDHRTRMRRWTFSSALAALEATRALHALGGRKAWLEAAADHRARYLRAIDAGRPPSARTVVSAQRKVPNCFRHLGKCLPTKEAVEALRDLEPIVEFGAGFGLFARALHQAGITVFASDPDTSGEAGIAYDHMLLGRDASSLLEDLASLSRPATMLAVWPSLREGDWFTELFRAARPGDVVAMASPEFELAFRRGARPSIEAAGGRVGPGWMAMDGLLSLISSKFEELRDVPVVGAGWPMTTTPLRVWRRIER